MRASQIAVLSAGLIAVAAILVSTRGVEAVDGAADPGARFASDPLTGFERLEARGRWVITAVQGAQWEVTVDAAPDLAARLIVEVQEDRLVLDHAPDPRRWWQRMFDRAPPAAAHIVMPALAGVELAGVTTFEMSGFEGTTLTLVASGVSQIKGYDGRYDEIQLVVSGTGDVDLAGVVVDDARLLLSGAATVTLHMQGGALSGTAAGAADIRYHGSVSSQNIAISGAGSVRPIGAGPPE